MKPQFALAFVIATAPALAQSTGVSHPDPVVDPIPPVSTPAIAKPSAAIPATTAPTTLPAPPPTEDEFKAYTPYNGPAVTLHTHDAAATADPDASFVTGAPHRPGELPIGTVLRARLRASIATETTQQNAPFTAVLSEDIREGNRTVVPAGSVVEGTVTKVRGGKRFRGAALIHLQAQRVVLPDGATLPLQAQLTDTDQYADTRTDGEGNIIRKDHAKATFITISAVTGIGAATGALVGGGVGAIVGAGIGAGIGTAVWLRQDRQARLPQDTLLVFSLTDQLNVNPRPDFVAIPERPSASVAAVPVAAPMYGAPQAFVPTN